MVCMPIKENNYTVIYIPGQLTVADPGGFHWFPWKPPFKSEDYFNTYIYAAIKNILKYILCTVTQPFLTNQVPS